MADQKLASIVVLQRGVFRGEVFKNIQAAASHALDVLMRQPKDWQCLHSIRDHQNNVVWTYEGGHGLSMAILYGLIYVGEKKERSYEQDQQ